MDLREFAESILFAGSFEEKLAAPTHFTDEKPGKRIDAPLKPTRSNNLCFHEENSGHARLTFPKDSLLKSENERAKVFHAFANHELLALELMALAILKFPESPTAFRMGLAYCLKEEQEHLKLYLKRMRDFGVEFGDFRVNGFFWNVLREMKSPLDFVTGMSLTFEQANLDFSAHYSNLFKMMGDLESHEIMQRVYQEEIGHVKFGVQWFDKWRPSEETQWKFYCNNLTFPLTPERAKGASFSPKHREKTGLSEDFIEKLEAFSHSRGRPPRVFIFNSNCELEWAAYSKKQLGYTAPKFQEEIVSDFASLMQFLGHKEDIVALPAPPTLSMIRSWREWGFTTPNFIKYSSQNPTALTEELKKFKVNSLEPWGWSPRLAKELAVFQKSLLKQNEEWPPFKESIWNKIAPCYQKSSVPALLKDLLNQHSKWKHTVCPLDYIGRVCPSLNDVLEETDRILTKESLPVVLKAPLGSSGFNMIRILKTPLEEQQIGWIKNTLQAQEKVIVEPWLERVADFSMQIEVNRFSETNKVSVIGFTRMLSDSRGQYIGHQLGGKLDDLSEEIRKIFYQGTDSTPSWHNILKEAAIEVGNWLLSHGYHGPAGIDAFVYRCPKTKKFLLKPIVEINARFTMGRIALRLEEQLFPSFSGFWVHQSLQRLKKLGRSNWEEWLTDLKQKIATEIILPPEPTGMIRLKSGVFPTTDPATAKSFFSVLLVGKEIEELKKTAQLEELTYIS